jgi:hypothetical protein
MGILILKVFSLEINALFLFTKTTVVNSLGEVGLERTSADLLDLGCSKQPFRYKP